MLKLEAQGLGCHRNGMFVGTFIHADDITILAPTSTSLNKMLDTCKQYADDVNLTFNIPAKLNACTLTIQVLQIFPIILSLCTNLLNLFLKYKYYV